MLKLADKVYPAGTEVEVEYRRKDTAVSVVVALVLEAEASKAQIEKLVRDQLAKVGWDPEFLDEAGFTEV